ncbi:Lichenan-specific phosphotransferase enzyme IIA component [bioreactor metagenome]|uniref:Lichenan-specific phosphotransferase enzyme IIA component n=1 Tax=bioreactor metagenome TaxID=1076179 RepID=A0A645FG89_9ZZZZ
MDMDYQEIMLQIIVNGGNARSCSMEAIQLAKVNKFEEAREVLGKANEELAKAHISQTKLIQNEASGNAVEVSLIMVHAQDHLMNAITVKDLAQEFIDMYERIAKQ